MKIPDVYKSSIALGFSPEEAQEIQAKLEKRVKDSLDPTIKIVTSNEWGTMYKDPVADWEKVEPLKIIVVYRPIVDSISFVVKENGEFRHFRYDDDYYLLETLGTIDVKDIQADIAAGEVITVSYRHGQLGKKLKGFKEDFYMYYTELR